MNRPAKIAALVVGIPAGILGLLLVKTLLDPKARDRMDARDACEAMIEAYSKNPETAEIEIIRPLPDGPDRLLMEWTPDTLRLQNSFGAMLGTYVSCTYNTKTDRVEAFDMR